jgi:hypothetical protein
VGARHGAWGKIVWVNVTGKNEKQMQEMSSHFVVHHPVHAVDELPRGQQTVHAWS